MRLTWPSSSRPRRSGWSWTPTTSGGIPQLAAQIDRARGRIASVQLCDWVVPLPADTLLGRGHLGDGVIDFPPVVAGVLAAGYPGFLEIEIFNQDVWDAPADQTAATIWQRFARLLD